MKTVLLFLLLAFTFNLYSQVHVRGYYRSNGTYVQPHERTAPNSTITDNYSYPGNYNPNTVYNNSSSNTTYNNSNSNSIDTVEWVNGYYRKDGTYIRGYYRTKVKSNETDNSNSYTKKYVNASQVNVRTSPEISNNVMTKLNYGDEMQSVFIVGDWEKVVVKKYNSDTYNYQTYVGYINSNYLSNYSPTSSSSYSTTNSNYSEINLKKYKVNSEKAYFYTTPSIYDKKSAYLVYGEIIQAIAEGQYFIYIEFVNTSGIKTMGWILKEDLLVN